MSLPQPYIIFLSGVSGAGKTYLVHRLIAINSADTSIKFLFFDSIGVPSHEEMVRQYGSGKEWQKATTYQWIARILHDYSHKRVVVIEGQTELKFIEAAFLHYGVTTYKIILIEARHEVRHQRLQEGRKQPELINDKMDNWARYLHDQAQAMGVDILDNSDDDSEPCVNALQKIIEGH